MSIKSRLKEFIMLLKGKNGVLKLLFKWFLVLRYVQGHNVNQYVLIFFYLDAASTVHCKLRTLSKLCFRSSKSD